MSKKVKIYFEAEETFTNLKNNNKNIADTLLMIRLIELVLSVNEVFPDYDEKMKFYQSELEKVFGKEYFSG